VIEAAADGIDHTALVNMILDTALRRYGMKGVNGFSINLL
jgi:hypothetical protein